MKCLGKWCDDSLQEKKNVSHNKKMEEWVKRIDKSGVLDIPT